MTIREIAKHINCSASTVYRALHNPETVSPKTREQIQNLLNQNNMNPQKILRAYIILPQMNVFYSSLLVELSNILIPENIQIIPFICNEDPKKEQEILQSINFPSNSALIWNPVDPNSAYSILTRKYNKPRIILLNRSHNIYNSEISISYGNSEAIQTSIDILSQNGAKKILLVSSNERKKTILERNESFLSTIKASSSLSGDIFHTDFLHWHNAYNDLLKNHDTLEQYDSLISGSESIGLAFLKYFYKYPEFKNKIKFITFDYTLTFDIASLSMIYFPMNTIVQKITAALLDKTSDPLLQYYILPQIQLLGSERGTSS